MIIYLDNAATTPVNPIVLKTMLPYFSKLYGNPSEFHYLGRQSKIASEKARDKIAKFLNCSTKEIFFTSGATESINLSIKGLIESVSYEFKDGQKPHILTSSIEHKAVLETVEHLRRNNQAEVSYLPVNSQGLVNIGDIRKLINKNTVLISIMYVNNETGTVEPIQTIGKFIRELNNSKKHRKIFFHTDATQATGYFDCNVKDLEVDMLSLSGHKIYAPKGIGVLYKKSTVPITRQLDGGGQESSIRASTENLASIVGLGKAIEIASRNRSKEFKRLTILRNHLIRMVLKIPKTQLTGHPTKRAPHIASFVINNVEGEAMVMHLSNKGIYASSGSACTASDLKSSHVLSAMGIPPETSHGSLRFSLGDKTTLMDLKITVKELKTIVKSLREISPGLEGLYNE